MGSSGKTRMPTNTPTAAPTTSPPTKKTTAAPTTSPPTKKPTEAPTTSPPTKNPTAAPTTSPPSKKLTAAPTTSPSTTLSEAPTSSVSQIFTAAPTSSPTETLSAIPTSSSTKTPSAAPTTSPPTKKLTEAPTTSPPTKKTTAAPTVAVTDIEKPTSDKTTYSASGAKGDPHFKLWDGEAYDFHGICDLVLLHNPEFNNGLGMDIHIRTKKMKHWSYIKTAVIRIGNESFEVMAERKHNYYWNNRIAGDEEIYAMKELPATISGYNIQFRKINSQQLEYTIVLGNNKNNNNNLRNSNKTNKNR